jgi:tetratricopeptide (TPR) repeat protein
MKELFFWRVWSVSERSTAISGLIVIVFALLFFILKGIDPLANVIRWDVLSELSEISTVVDILKFDAWQYGISVPSNLVTEQFVASTMETDFLALKIFWGIVMIGLSFILAALTTLPRFWYLTGMVVFILLLASARLETLGVFGEGSRALFIVSVTLFAGLSYYFHAFRSDIGMGTRILGLLGVSVFLLALVGFFSTVSFPALTVAAYSLPIWLLISIVFLLVSATEIVAALVWLSTSGKSKTGKSGLTNFLVISILYLLSLLLLYLKNTRQIDWDLTLLSPVYLAILAGLLGIWGFKKRTDSTNGLISFRSTGFWLYIGLFIVTAAFTTYVAGTANDPLLEVLEDVVVNGQLAMSIVFLFYIIVNFYPVFKQGLAVHKVLYKPMRFGLTQTRLFGFAGVVVLFSMQRLLPVYQGIAGYFNGLGDLYANTGEYPLAEQYYKMALQQEFQNHKSNYALASLALRQGDKVAATYYFRQALLKNPSPQAYAGLTGVLMQESLFFDAVFSLQEGLRAFPKSGELLNNLGMLYAKTNVADSAYYYLDKAEKSIGRSEVPATNLLAIWARSTDEGLLDSLASHSNEHTYLSWQANWLAVQNLRQKFAKQSFKRDAISKDSVLSVSSLAYVLNYARNQAVMDSLPASFLPKLADKNPLLSEDLSLGSLYPEFYSGNKLKAIETLSIWAEQGGEKSKMYHKVLGHWLLQVGLYDLAIQHLALVEGLEGVLGQAVGYALSGQQAIGGLLLQRMQEKQPNPALQKLQNSLMTLKPIKTKSDSLFAIAKADASDKNFDAAVHANPFDASIVAAAAHHFGQKKQVSKAYKIVLDAMKFNDRAPLLWQEYTILSLQQGLTDQADEGEAQVRELSSPAGYQAFVTRYQPMRALIEKQRADFH